MNAPNARDRLKVDREMFARILTYHQVMPSYLDLVFAFGKQEHPKDFHFCGFRADSRLDNDAPKLELRERRRSGRELRMCYSLRSVESVESQRHWPWSIRQCAVYHAYDVETELATWIVIKANKVIRNRIKSIVDNRTPSVQNSFALEYPALKSALDTHHMICSWSTESWRWYINFLEQRFQQISAKTLTESTTLESLRQEMSAPVAAPNSDTGNERNGRDEQQGTSFDQLQDVHFVEEKTNEALLVVKGNQDVLDSLRQHYQDSFDMLRYDDDLDVSQFQAIPRFRDRVERVRKELVMQQHRLETLLKMIADRRSLVRPITPLMAL